MTLDLIASQIQEAREAGIAQAALERRVRGDRPTRLARGRAALGRRVIAVGQALGGDALRQGRAATATRPGSYSRP